MCVFRGQARVVVHKGIASVDADDAEASRWKGAAALRVADVIAGRSGDVRHWASMAAEEGGGRGQDRDDRQQMIHRAASFCKPVDGDSNAPASPGNDSDAVPHPDPDHAPAT